MSSLVLQTRVSKALWDEHIIFGKKLFAEIVPGGLAQQIALVISGRTLAQEDVLLFEHLISCLCLPDPHIWPLRIARIAASYGRSTQGLAAGLLLFESERVGNRTTSAAADWLADMSARIGDDITKERVFDVANSIFADVKVIPGFGVPFRDEDERVVALHDLVRDTEHASRRHFRIYELAAEWVKINRSIAPNYSAPGAALMLDLGFAPKDASPVVLLGVHLAQLPNAIEGAAQSASILRELPREAISYEGHAPRSLTLTDRHPSTRR